MHASLADVVADLAQNGIEAGARRLALLLDEGPDEVRIVVEDDGKGMDEEVLAKAEDPFWTDGKKHPGRRVGLGIPFLRQTAEQCGGRADIISAPGEGTRVEAVFPAENVDLPPVGDVVLLWVQCLSLPGGCAMSVRRVLRFPGGEEREYAIDRDEMSEALGGLKDAGALGLLREYVCSLEESLVNETE
jgi:hypothetical protein